MKRITVAVALCSLVMASCGQKWEPLFNGEDLTGWHQATGQASYVVEDGAIVGIVGPSKVNSFLVTDNSYGDFILEFSFMISEGCNSGVQFRSFVNDQKGRAQGYQCEFDPSERKWTGGLYDEQGRGWLYPLTFNIPAGDAYKAGEWNSGRIEAVGTSLKTYINGTLCTDTVDDAYADGFIGLQVHVTKDTTLWGSKLRWKDLRICTKNPGKYLLPDEGEIHQVNAIAGTLSERQKAEGWKLADSFDAVPGDNCMLSFEFRISNPKECTALVDTLSSISPDCWFRKAQINTVWVSMKDGERSVSMNGVPCKWPETLDTTGADIQIQSIMYKEL